MKQLITGTLALLMLTGTALAQNVADIDSVDQKPQTGVTYSYESFCPNDQYFVNCESRLKRFVYDNKRTPATDQELVDVYFLKNKEDLFAPNEDQAQKRFIVFRNKTNSQFKTAFKTKQN